MMQRGYSYTRGGGGSRIIAGTVDTYTGLPDAASQQGKLWFVKNGSNGVLSIFGAFKYPRGLYSPNASNVWEIVPFNVRTSEDTVTLLNITNWAEYISYSFDIHKHDRIVYSGREYVNLTGAQTASAPNVDATNWKCVELSAAVNPELIDRFEFRINTVTGKASLWENVTGSWLHRVDFGSVTTNKFVFTRVMGGLKYLHTDGKEYYIARVSPDTSGTGQTDRSAVFGNYVAKSFIANSGGVFITNKSETPVSIEVPQTRVYHVDTVLLKINPTVEQGDCIFDSAVIQNVANQGVVLARVAWKNKAGDILFESIEKEVFDALTDETALVQNGARHVDLSVAGATSLSFATDIPISPGDELFHEWNFKHQINFNLDINDQLSCIIEGHKLVIEQAATREWVEAQLPTSLKAFYTIPNTWYGSHFIDDFMSSFGLRFIFVRVPVTPDPLHTIIIRVTDALDNHITTVFAYGDTSIYDGANVGDYRWVGSYQPAHTGNVILDQASENAGYVANGKIIIDNVANGPLIFELTIGSDMVAGTKKIMINYEHGFS